MNTRLNAHVKRRITWYCKTIRNQYIFRARLRQFTQMFLTRNLNLDYRNLFLTLSEQSYLRQDFKFLKSITRWIKFRALIFIYIKQELNFSTRICEKKSLKWNWMICKILFPEHHRNRLTPTRRGSPGTRLGNTLWLPMKSLRKITEGRLGISESCIPSDRLIVTVVVGTKIRRKIWQFKYHVTHVTQVSNKL